MKVTPTPTSDAADRAIENCPELNMGNYDEVDVERLNDWAIRANDEIDRLHALAAGQATAAPAQPAAQQGAADGFFLLLPQRPKPEAPAGTVGLDWDAYSGAQMLAFGRDSSDAAIAALRTEQPAQSGATEEVENLRKALVYAAFALHGTPQYMLAQGITLIDGDTVRVSRDGWTVEASVNPHRQPAPATQQAGEAWQARASHGQAPAGAGMGHTDGGRNMFYEGRFDGESQREQQARLRWANDMRAAFERHTGNGWFDKDWRTETGLWSSAWHACLAAQPTTTAQAAPAYKDSAPELHIGDSAFESWYSTYSPAHKSDKQRARDAYAAGMGDPLVTAAPATVAGPSEAVAYLDVGAGGYLDLGSDLSEDALQQLPKGRHALVIAGTYGIDGYVAAPQTSPTAQAADSVQEDAADPLQGAANWLAEAHGQFSPVVLSGCLMIGYNRAKRLHDAALAARKQGGL